MTDLVRLEITLWDHVDARLKQAHDLGLASYETLFVLDVSGRDTLRVGDLARELRITVGGASKLADRICGAGLIERTPDPDDRRASLVALTPAGRDRLAAATVTYEAALAEMLDGVLTDDEQRSLHDLVRKALAGPYGLRATKP
ncbi:MarR family winged helix-turn-helix transcriptional regulator [Micromonosporaceae bacterium Da 78-11]